MAHAAQQELIRLLLSLFSAAEFRRFLRYNLQEDITPDLPGPSTSFRQLAEEAVDLLDRGGLVDAAFFQALVAERPRRAGEIRAVEKLFGRPEPAAGEPWAFFLCHASPDKPVALQLFERLQARGYRTFVDQHALPPGVAWSQAIPQAIERSEVFVVLLSALTAGKAHYLGEEAVFAVNLERTGRLVVVPVHLDDPPAPAPFGLQQYHALMVKHGIDKVADDLVAILLARRNKVKP